MVHRGPRRKASHFFERSLVRIVHLEITKLNWDQENTRIKIKDLRRDMVSIRRQVDKYLAICLGFLENLQQ